jgi:hypothetical protein
MKSTDIHERDEMRKLLTRVTDARDVLANAKESLVLAEGDAMDKLIQLGAFDCFTVNWRKANRIFFDWERKLKGKA